MSYETDLRDIACANYADFIKPALVEFNAAYSRIKEANDPDGAAVDLISAAEYFRDRLADMASALRDGLLSEMKETGQFEVAGNGIVASLRAGSTSGQVTDEKALKAAHPDLYLAQPDKLDKARLTKMLKTLSSVPGAKLSTGAPTLAIKKA